MQWRSGRFDYFAYTTAAIIAVFLMVERLMYVNLAIMGCLLATLVVLKRGHVVVHKSALALTSIACLIALQALVRPSMLFDENVALKEMARIAVYIILVMLIANLKIRERYFVSLWLTIFLVTLLVSTFQFYKVLGINDILASVYGDSIQLDVARKYTSLPQFRAGSVFVNPNSYAKFILAFLSIMLAYSGFKRRYGWGLMLMILAALTLAGSRTGVVIAVVLGVIHLFSGIRIGRNKRAAARTLLLAIAVTGVVAIVVLGLPTSDGLLPGQEIRALNLSGGISTSLRYKVSTFLSIVRDFTAMNLVLGMGPFKTDLRYVTLIDFDLGYLFCFFGITGCCLYALLLASIHRAGRACTRTKQRLNLCLIIVTILFGFTGGVFLNLRTFSFLISLFFVRVEPSLGET